MLPCPFPMMITITPGTITPGQSGPGSNGNERVLYTHPDIQN